MKYMGSKRSMLKNGLGMLLLRESAQHDRFVDLFTGAGFVAWYVAENINKPVLAVDLQKYSTTLARAVIGRAQALSPNDLITTWIEDSCRKRDANPLWAEAWDLQARKVRSVKNWVNDARKLCSEKSNVGPIWSAYGGHYFSPVQALSVDYLLANLPSSEPKRTLCLAAVLSAASECVASPGHTAQPFQPTETASPYIIDAWNRDVIEYTKKNLINIASRHAQIKGATHTGDALSVIPKLTGNDLVFIDPPYSSVQYSRFYHVLETIARLERKIEVDGIGRYPSLSKRPQSDYSNTGQAEAAVKGLLQAIAEKSCEVIFTFPHGNASNGLSGNKIKEIANEWFNVEDHSMIEGKFSTLGGNNANRDARKKSSELILVMTPK